MSNFSYDILTVFAYATTLLANVLPGILHIVLQIARVKISRYCSTIDFTEDYFRQQSHATREQRPLSLRS